MQENLTTEQKIDFIYTELKKRKRNNIFKIFFNIIYYGVIIGGMLYFYYIGFDKMKQGIIEAIKPEISAEAITSGIKDGSSDLLQKAMEMYNEKLGN